MHVTIFFQHIFNFFLFCLQLFCFVYFERVGETHNHNVECVACLPCAVLCQIVFFSCCFVSLVLFCFVFFTIWQFGMQCARWRHQLAAVALTTVVASNVVCLHWTQISFHCIEILSLSLSHFWQYICFHYVCLVYTFTKCREFVVGMFFFLWVCALLLGVRIIWGRAINKQTNKRKKTRMSERKKRIGTVKHFCGILCIINKLFFVRFFFCYSVVVFRLHFSYSQFTCSTG